MKSIHEMEHPNIPLYDSGCFQWGPTKSAVILRDMARTYDSVVSGGNLEKKIGRSFDRINLVLDIISTSYKVAQEKKFGKWQASFKEHLVWNVVDDEITMINRSMQYPQETVRLIRTVAKEKINLRKLALGFGKKKSGVDYTTWDVNEWSQSERVKKARIKWKNNLKERISVDIRCQDYPYNF